MQIGIGLPATIPGTSGPLVLDWAKRADSGPFSSLAIIDRLVYLGWTTPRVRHPEQADLWTWLMVVAFTQLRACANRRVAYVTRACVKAIKSLRELPSAKSCQPIGAASKSGACMRERPKASLGEVLRSRSSDAVASASRRFVDFADA